MKFTKQKAPAPAVPESDASRSLITDAHLQEFLAKLETQRKGYKPQDLAKLINVNPASVSRWLKGGRPYPTSTSLLVLLPLIIASGVEVVEPADEAAIHQQFALAQKLGILKKDQLADPKKLQRLRKAVALVQCPEFAAARSLYNELKQAWDTIDAAIFDESSGSEVG